MNNADDVSIKLIKLFLTINNNKYCMNAFRSDWSQDLFALGGTRSLRHWMTFPPEEEFLLIQTSSKQRVLITNLLKVSIVYYNYGSSEDKRSARAHI